MRSKGADWAESLGEVVRLRRFWILVLVSISINVCWHFLVNWLPIYLIEDRGMTLPRRRPLQRDSVPGGRRGEHRRRSLVRVPGPSGDERRPKPGCWSSPVCTLLITGGALVGSVSNDTLVLVLIAFMAMGTAAFMANYFAFIQEVSPRHTGLVVGILGGLGNLFAAGFHPVVGWVKDATGSFRGLVRGRGPDSVHRIGRLGFGVGEPIGGGGIELDGFRRI